MAEPETEQPLIPARMLNEFVYCPRLAILEWVDGEFAHSADTVEGAVRHARVDRPGFRVRRKSEEAAENGEAGIAEAPRASSEVLQLRSVELSDPELGVTAKLDLVEIQGDLARPIDTKKGKRPHIARGVYDPERVQLCAQALLLRKNGYRCDTGAIYYAGSNERVEVPIDAELIALTHSMIAGLREAARADLLPPPLEDSPKCVRCSLAPICLPDETRFLRGEQVELRQLIPAADHSFPLYVQQAGASVRKSGDLLQVWAEDEKIGEMRLGEISQLVLFGRCQATEPTLRECLQRGIPVIHLSQGGWLYGTTEGLPHRNVRLRQQQFRLADDPGARLRIARRLVHAKLRNQRTFLRRNAGEETLEPALDEIRRHARSALRAESFESLLGHEGRGARVYFEQLGKLFKQPAEIGARFDFTGRNRRPPRDPVNALLSFLYSMLSREWVTVCRSVGFDPYLGFLHEPRYGRPALALDLMEAFRPIVADSTVLRMINNGEIAPRDFVERMGACGLNEWGRRKALRAFEQRLAQEITHPVFGYRVSYRRIFEVEGRLLARHLMGELSTYHPLMTR